jgi:hypothetical protein
MDNKNVPKNIQKKEEKVLNDKSFDILINTKQTSDDTSKNGQMDNKKVPKVPKIHTEKYKKQMYICEKCNYNTSRKSQYQRHLLTNKHSKYNLEEQLENKFVCCCGKLYNYLTGLCKHKKICSFINNKNNNNSNNDKDIIFQLLKQNEDFKTLVIEQNSALLNIHKNATISQNITNINNINNINNKTFNLNVFLNETCKDAMNIMDFVDSLKIQLSDLEIVGKLGFVEGISNIIVKNLKALDIHKRPVHCSDPKRETIYVKDNNKWEKDNNDKYKLRKAIKYIAHKNSKMLPEFKEKYPDCVYSNSKKSDQYNKLIIEAMGGKGNNDCEKEDKIIKNIVKEVVIDKNIN